MSYKAEKNIIGRWWENNQGIIMVQVFVYGSLMSKYKNGVTAFLPDHRISFIVKGTSWFEPSFATLVFSPGEIAWGVVIEIPEIEWKEHLKREISYLPKTIEVYQGKQKINCIAFFLDKTTLTLKKEIGPSARYANLLYQGALHHQLPEKVISRYQQLQETGNPWTKRLTFLFPLARLFVPLVGRRRAFLTCLIFLGISFFILIISMIFMVI